MYIIRPATAADQAPIEALIHKAHLNSRDLNWRDFFIAEENGQVVGVRQVRVHAQGTHEIASGYVLPEHRRKGVSRMLMDAILEREKGDLFLFCDRKWSIYYEAFGFQKIEPSALPHDIGSEYRAEKMRTSMLAVFAARRMQIIPMKREAV